MANTPHLSRNERRLINKCTNEGFAVPKVFKEWMRFFDSRRSYEAEFEEWLAIKIRMHGAPVIIQTDKNMDEAVRLMGGASSRPPEKTKERSALDDPFIYDPEDDWDPQFSWTKKIVIPAPSGVCGTAHFVM